VVERAGANRPFVTVLPRSLFPVVLTCEHASRSLPVRLRRSREIDRVLASHWGWDIGAWDVTLRVARILGTSAIGGRFTRLWLDLNRAPGDATLVRERAGRVGLPWNARLDADRIERRVLSVHAPYHAEVDRLVLRRVLRGIRPLLFAVHSFTPVLGRERRPFDIGVLFARHAPLARAIGRSLARDGLTVRYNEPYSGLAGMMYAAERHGSHHGVPCLELEMNQALFRDPEAARLLARSVAAALGATSSS
jgi:predicted N-formylglutamate amidohydrolase